MEAYILKPNFARSEIVDKFLSFIWTERYNKAGDFALSVAPTQQNFERFRNGTFVGAPGTKEVMIVDTALIEKGVLKVTGSSLLGFFENLIIRNSGAHNIRTWELDSQPAGQFMAAFVSNCAIPGPSLFPDSVGVAYSKQAIPNLSLGAYDTSGGNVAISVPFGQLYSVLTNMAEIYGLGMSLYLDAVSDTTYSLKFTTYRGKDLTSQQNVNPIVRFSPALDSLTDVKEINSVAGFKNVAYAYATSFPYDAATSPPGYASVGGISDTSVGFERRAIHVMVDDIQYDEEAPLSPSVLKIFLDQRARDALANNNYTRVMDGEVVPQSEFKYKQHYFLGDIVELVGSERISQRARITEYIRSHDATGERSYPTVSVIS